MFKKNFFLLFYLRQSGENRRGQNFESNRKNDIAKLLLCLGRCISLSLCRGDSPLSVGDRPLSATSTRAVDTPGAIYLLLRTDAAAAAAAAASDRARACAARVRSLASAHPRARARVSARPAHALRLRGVY